MSKFVGMGDYYFSKDGVLRVKTVCKAQHHLTKVPIIVYAEVFDGGFVQDLTWMEEKEFMSRFLEV